MDDFQMDNLKIKVWDLAGQEKLRKSWKYYYESVNGLVFVIDASDKTEISDVRETLMQVINETQEQALPILVIANKQDVEGALRGEELNHELGVTHDLLMRRKLHV